MSLKPEGADGGVSPWKQKAMWVTLLMGFSSGLPFLLTLRTLQAWMTDIGVDLKTVGFFALVGLPYSLKFIWAPLFDRFTPLRLGRRRGWLVIVQSALVLALLGAALTDPKTHVFVMAGIAVLIAFLSASQDVIIDAYRRESLQDNQLGLGSTFYLYGYRGSMWISGALAIGMASAISWNMVYAIMAGLSLLGVSFTLWADEPVNIRKPLTLNKAFTEPFLEFLNRPSVAWILLFIVMYKIGEAMAGNMLTPFYFKMGYTKVEIAAIAKSMSIIFILFGSFVGAWIVHKRGIIYGLWTCGLAQSVAVLTISILTTVDKNLWALGSIIGLEDLSTSMASAAFVAYLASITNKKYSATQYALLSSLASIPRVILSSPAGWLAENLGWPGFFVLCAVITVPGLLLIPKIARTGIPEEQALKGNLA